MEERRAEVLVGTATGNRFHHDKIPPLTLAILLVTIARSLLLSPLSYSTIACFSTFIGLLSFCWALTHK